MQKLQKGPVSAAHRKEIEGLFKAGMTLAQIAAKYNRSEKVIQTVLSNIALQPTESPSTQRRKLRIVLEVETADINISLPNGIKYTFELPIGLDATNNSAILAQIEAQLRAKQSETNEGLTLTEKELDLYA